jgi:gliding motility-associated-like protein
MKKFRHITILACIWILQVLLGLHYAVAQERNVVYANQSSELKVEYEDGMLYYWELYTMDTGINFATMPGNCPSVDAWFVNGNTGSSAEVFWASPGFYFFKITVSSPGCASNIKIGIMEVLQPLPLAAFLPASPICFGSEGVIAAELSGTPPFTVTYTNGSDTATIENITNHLLEIIVHPTHTTDYWILSITDYYGVPNNEITGPLTVVVNPLPIIVALHLTHSVDGQPDGEVEIIAGGQALPLEYSIDGLHWQNSNLFTGLIAGNYTAWVRDANQCMATLDFAILNIVTGEIELIAGAIGSCRYTAIEVPVIAVGFTNITAFTIEMEFDADIIEYLQVTGVNLALASGSLTSMQIKSGVLHIAFESDIAVTIPPDEKLFFVEFLAKGTGITALDWHTLHCVFLIPGGYPVPTIYTHGLAEVVPSPQLLVIGAGNYCEGQELTLEAVTLSSNQNIEYMWQGPAGDVMYEQSWNLGSLGPEHSGVYSLLASNSLGCDTLAYAQIKVNPLPQPRLHASDTMCMKGPVWLEPGMSYTSYLWQDGSRQADYYATQQGFYWVEVTDGNDCTNIATLALLPCDVELIIPNAFTPNGDGLNDIFKPLSPEFSLVNYQMLIYNKWGQLLFESSSISSGWDGTFRGKPVPTDIYSYIILYELPSYFGTQPPRQVSGSVMVVR